MEFKNFTYLLLLLIFAIIPAVLSRKLQVRTFTKIKYLLPAIVFTGTIFIIWEIRFTGLGIWSFDPDFITGKYILNLPIEEWLFFLVFPYFAVFVYEFTKIKFERFENPNLFAAISLVLLVIFGLLAYFLRQKLYPFFTFFLLAIYFGYTIFRNKFKMHLTKFYFSYLMISVPFLILKGILTALPVITYDPSHIVGIHIFTIPIEDLGFLFLLHLMIVTIYEYLKGRQYY